MFESLRPELLLAFGIGYQELLIAAAVLALLFGSAKLPSLMRNMGRSINEFKAGMKDKPKPGDNGGKKLEDNRDYDNRDCDNRDEDDRDAE